MQDNRNGSRVSAYPQDAPRRGRGGYDDWYDDEPRRGGRDDRYDDRRDARRSERYDDRRDDRRDDRYDDRRDDRYDDRCDDRYDDRRSGRASFEDSERTRRVGLLRAHRVVVSMLLVLMILFNAGYAVFSTFFNRMNIVEKEPEKEFVPTQEQLAEVADELGSVSESDFQMPEGTIMSDKDVEVILVVGCDVRPTQTEPGRSDTMILAFLDRVHKKIKLASIMRDLWAPIAGVKGSNKINYTYYLDTAWGNDDIHITRNTIQNCFGINIDHFVCIDFHGFIDVIEAIGEIDVEMTAAEAKYMVEQNRWRQPRYIGKKEAGVYHLNGEESLAYVRMRYVGEGDFDRTHRQQYFVSLLLERVRTDLSLQKLVDILNVGLPYISTDFSEGQMLGYIAEAPTIAKYDMVSLTFPVAGAYRMGWATVGRTNISVLLTNYTFLADAMNKFIYEDDMTYVNGGKASGVAIPTNMTSSFTTTTEFIPPETPEDPPAETPTDPPAEAPASE